ncbi:MAG: LPS export ABC transporter permease LptF [Gammaproteobacteria bacterium]|nr:MAG: LPS export ABC transporter permease LptF [Gammaproteobacteria bacterium]
MILRRYFHHEIWKTFLAILAILVLIYMGHRFVRFLNQAASGDLPEQAIAALLFYKTISAQVILVPLSAFLGTLITLGRMHHDNEITALVSTGYSPTNLLRHVALFSIVLSGLVGSISLYLGPNAEEKSYQIQDRMRADLSAQSIHPAQFNTFDHGKNIVYAESSTDQGKTLHHVFVQRNTSGEKTEVILAETAERQVDTETGEDFFILRQGHRYELSKNRQDGTRIDFEENGILIQPLEIEERLRKAWARPTPYLLEHPSLKNLAEVQWRLSAVISTLLLPLLAYFLSKTEGRSGKYARIMTGLLVFLIYNNLLAASKAWLENGDIPPIVGLWWVHGGLITLILILAYRQGVWPGRHRNTVRT